MANNQNSEKITIANIVSIIGVVLLFVFTFLGYIYKNGGEITLSILLSLGVAGFATLLLWLLIKAKGAENDLKKWKMAETVILVVYIIFAIVSLGGMKHFFVVNDAKEDIKKYAVQDFAKIDSLVNDYKTFEGEAISNTYMGLKNALVHRRNPALIQFMKEYELTDESSLRVFEEEKSRQLLAEDDGGNFAQILTYYTEQRDNLLQSVENWNVMLIPFKSKRVDELATYMEESLTQLSETGAATLPEIREENNGCQKIYVKGNNQQKEFKVEGGIESFQFRTAIMEAESSSSTTLVVAILFTLLVHLLIIFNYIVAYRTNTLKITNFEEDGGRIL